ncbi:hypothetical protein [Virgibacillus sp. SK37]|uniref:LppM family (lipo)protein n=1 Tax=Virgibacillus sp. SK37 TaxID=403957 RepID=UPI0004D15277|nr:hypothetical protein [Virgibacillus sp. SK37]AIF45358.1 hypothetical protein X953_07820 [Virgibacillus sp. SK37]
MKHYLLLGLLLCSAFLLTGFVRVDYYVNVDEDENADIKLVAETDEFNKAEVEQYITNNFLNSLENEPYKNLSWKVYELKDKTRFEANTNYEGMYKEFDLQHFGEFSIGGNSSGSYLNLPFYSKGSFDAVMYIRENAPEGFLDQHFLNENVDMQVHVRLPFPVKSHNGKYNGEEIVWEINPYEKNDLSFTYVKNQLYIPFSFLLAIIITGLIFIKKRRKKKKQLSETPIHAEEFNYEKVIH